MKKLLLILLTVVVSASLVWALPDQTQPVEVSGSQTIKTTSGTVYMISVNFAGVTAGDKVQIIDGGASGTIRLTCVAGAANGTCAVPLTVGAYFGTNIYYKETKSGGTFSTDVQFF